MKEGWTLAIGEYHELSLYIRHCDITNFYSEAILCPVTKSNSLFPICQSVLKAGSIDISNELTDLQDGQAKDISSNDLPHTSIILCGFSTPFNDDIALRSIKMGLEVCNSLGCKSASIPIIDFSIDLEASIGMLIESFESFVLSNLTGFLCLNEVNICAADENELRVAGEACKFRMTRYPVFVNIGMPGKASTPGFCYCFDCCKIYPLNNKCEHIS